METHAAVDVPDIPYTRSGESGHEGSRTALLFAATYPERTGDLVLFELSVRGTQSSDYPWSPSEEE